MQFSVLMSVFGKEKPEFLSDALFSVWDAQNLKPDQIVLVKDGDLTLDLDKVISDWKVKLGMVLTVVSLPENVGLGAALNHGMRHCQYELVARMDTDDIALPERFQKQLNLFKNNPGLDVVGSFALEIDEHGVVGNIRQMPVSHDFIYDNLFTNPFIHPSVMFKKSSILSIGGYNEALIRRQDYDLWFRCAKVGMKFYNIPEPLLLYRFTDKTHARQSIKVMLNQSMIGYRGVSLLNQPYWKSLSCFVPLLRSMLPGKLQHTVYSWMRLFDPRQKGN